MHPDNEATASGSTTADESRAVVHFCSPGAPKILNVSNNTTKATLPLSDVSEAFKLTLKVLYDKLKHLGRLSVVVTQSKSDSWHEQQRLDGNEISNEDAHQWIMSGLGADEIVKAKAVHGVCRHNVRSGEILTIPNVQTNERTADSWYSKNGLQAYCGMRLTSLPECTLCVLWVVDPPESSVFKEAEQVLNGLFNSIDDITSNMVEKMVDFSELSEARNKVSEQGKQRQYMTHELQNQLVPLMTLIEGGMHIGEELLSSTLNTMCSILKNPSGVALSLSAHKQHTDGFKWFTNVCQFAKQMVRKPEVKFTYAYESKEAKDLLLLVDPSKLRQMIVNIVSNAQKFTCSGSIHFSMDVVASSPAGPDREMDVVLKVTDTGCGISEEDLTRVTELFVQVGSIDSRRNGIGMGLAVAKKIAESLHGGKLSIESKLYEGTTVSVAFRCPSRLPLPLAAPARCSEKQHNRNP